LRFVHFFLQKKINPFSKMSIKLLEQIAGARREPRRQKQEKIARKSVSATKRYNEFRPEEHPRLAFLREGIPLEDSPDTVRDSLTEAYLYYFVCDGDFIDRTNPLTPKYVGVLRVFNKYTQQYMFVHPLNDDLAQMYAERTDISRAWDVLPGDGSPYWVDRYAQRKCK
jgi:hypothetical protein